MKSALWPNVFKGWNETESETVLTLKSVPIFRGFTDKEFAELEQLIHRRTYKPDEYVFKNQAPGEGMYIIVSGGVKISIGSRHGKEQILAELKAGDFFGELALLGDEPRSASAIATDHSKLLGFFKPDLFSLLERNPALGNKILMNLAQVIGERSVRPISFLWKPKPTNQSYPEDLEIGHEDHQETQRIDSVKDITVSEEDVCRSVI